MSCHPDNVRRGLTQDGRPWTVQGRKAAVIAALLAGARTAPEIERYLGWHPGTASPVLVALRGEYVVVGARLDDGPKEWRLLRN